MKNLFNISVKARITIGFLVVVLSTAGMVLLAYFGIQNVRNAQNQVTEISSIRDQISDFNETELKIRSLFLEIFVETDKEQAKEKLSKIDRLGSEANELKKGISTALSGLKEEYKLFQKIQSNVNTYRSNRFLQIGLIEKGEFEKAHKMSVGVQKKVFKGITSDLDHLKMMLDERIAVELQTSNATLKNKTQQLIGIGALILVMAIIIILGINRLFTNISKNLRNSVNVLGTSSAEIKSTISEITVGTNETATSISETTTTVEEIRQTSMMAKDKAGKLMENSQQASQQAEQGLESSQQMMDAMDKIQDQMTFISETIMKLSEQNHSIGEITSTVADIADQSNLLAVNAAIEAAKAGEHGRGFTVVAQEIRSLAEQSKKSTAQVKEILNEIQRSTKQAVEAIQQGSEIVNEGGKLVQDDRKVVETLTETIEQAYQAAIQISSSSQQQLAGMDQIVPAMENIKQASEQNVTGMRQTQDAANKLNELGQSLQEILDRYKF